jgi:hypothetical protein
MVIDRIERYLNSFGRQVERDAKFELAQSKDAMGNARGNTALGESIRFQVVRTATGFDTMFFMEDYGTYLDEGVSGNQNEVYYTDYKGKKRISQYKYTTKQPPAGIIEKWIKRKGIKSDNKSDRSFAFAIAKSIKKRGIKSLSFFQQPLGIGLKELDENFLNEVAADIKSYLITYTKP